MGTLSWLHISDFHFRSDEQQFEENIIIQSFLDDIKNMMNNYFIKFNFIVVTGDITYSSNDKEYELAISFFNDLLQLTNLTKKELFIVPGNHDIQKFTIGKDEKNIDSMILEKLSLFNNEQIRKIAIRRMNNYFKFINSYMEGYISYDNEYYYSKIINDNNDSISIIGLNSAILSEGDKKEKHRLIVGDHQISSSLKNITNSKTKIVLLHHPFDWLEENDSKNTEKVLKNNFNFILQGHVHTDNYFFEDSIMKKNLIIQSGAMYYPSDYHNTYNIVKYDTENEEGIIYFRRYSPKINMWVKDLFITGDELDGSYEFYFGGRNEYSIPILSNREIELYSLKYDFKNHLNEKILVKNEIEVSWNFYKSCIDDLYNSLEKLDIEMSKNNKKIFLSFIYLAIKNFVPFREYLLRKQDKNISKKELERAAYSFSNILFDNYIIENNHKNEVGTKKSSARKDNNIVGVV